MQIQVDFYRINLKVFWKFFSKGAVHKGRPPFFWDFWPPLPPCHPRSLFADPPIKRMSLFADPPPSFSVFFLHNMGNMVLFSKRIPSKIGFWNAQHHIANMIFLFLLKKLCIFPHTEGTSLFHDPLPPMSPHVTFLQTPPWVTSFVNGPPDKSYT